MTDFAERKAAIELVLAQFYRRDASRLLPIWTKSTEGIPTPQLKVACDEICAQWTKAKPPVPGNLLEHAENRRGGGVTTIQREDLSLAAMQADARTWLAANGSPATDENVMRRVRGRIGFREGVVDGRTIRHNHPLAPLSAEGWQDALSAGVVTHIPKLADDTVRATVDQLRDLAHAGYGWCDEQRRFVPAREARDFDFEAEENGTPFPPRSMTDGAIAGAHAQLIAGKLAPIPKREPVKSGGFERLDAECPF